MQITDNLYKHLALWGLASLVFSLVYPFSQVHRFNLEAYELQAQATVDYNVKESLMAQRQSILEDSGGAAGNDPTLVDIDDELLMVTAQIDARTDKADYQLYIISLYTKFGLAGAVVGLLSAIVGFRLWYVRVQRPLDVYLQEHQRCHGEKS
ncbi:MAG: hypothetical protein KKD73_03305 [Proteobacteria bacterium]|nr:hypothetical protein [Pseudomonadota bacterium]MBU1640628.1 hypothetical protein [Pseudomonadota bacterium]